MSRFERADRRIVNPPVNGRVRAARPRKTGSWRNACRRLCGVGFIVTAFYCAAVIAADFVPPCRGGLKLEVIGRIPVCLFDMPASAMPGWYDALFGALFLCQVIAVPLWLGLWLWRGRLL